MIKSKINRLVCVLLIAICSANLQACEKLEFLNKEEVPVDTLTESTITGEILSVIENADCTSVEVMSADAGNVTINIYPAPAEPVEFPKETTKEDKTFLSVYGTINGELVPDVTVECNVMHSEFKNEYRAKDVTVTFIPLHVQVGFNGYDLMKAVHEDVYQVVHVDVDMTMNAHKDVRDYPYTYSVMQTIEKDENIYHDTITKHQGVDGWEDIVTSIKFYDIADKISYVNDNYAKWFKSDGEINTAIEIAQEDTDIEVTDFTLEGGRFYVKGTSKGFKQDNLINRTLKKFIEDIGGDLKNLSYKFYAAFDEETKQCILISYDVVYEGKAKADDYELTVQEGSIQINGIEYNGDDTVEIPEHVISLARYIGEEEETEVSTETSTEVETEPVPEREPDGLVCDVMLGIWKEDVNEESITAALGMDKPMIEYTFQCSADKLITYISDYITQYTFDDYSEYINNNAAAEIEDEFARNIIDTWMKSRLVSYDS